MAAGPTFEPIASTTLSSAASSITFNSIPQTYTDLRIVATLRQVTTYNDSRINFNSSISSYSGARFGIDATGSIYSTNTLTDTNGVWQNQNSLGAEDNAPYVWTTSITDVFAYTTNYTKAVLNKTFCAVDNQSPQLGAFNWSNTSQITSLTVQFPPNVTRQFSTGSVVTIYGIKAA